MHASRERGRGFPRILYWFRTPPNVRVGRAALDEDAIRLIESSNPDVLFDWNRILKGAPAAEPRAPERSRDRRAGPAHPDRPWRKTAPARVAAPEPSPSRAAEPPAAEGLEPTEVSETIEPERPPPAASHVEEQLGHEGLGRLKARYAELLARITERVSDPARLDELRGRAERLNPDTWVTDEEARQGIANFDAAYEALRNQVGRRRRRRRGGARRRARHQQLQGPGAGEAAHAHAPAEPERSNGEDPVV